MNVPPVFCVEDLTSDFVDDLREACQTYCSAGYTLAFDELFTDPERADLIGDFLCGEVPADVFATSVREWLLRPWGLAQSLGDSQLQAIANALARVGPAVATFPDSMHLDEADSRHLREMSAIFRILDDGAGVGPMISSALLGVLRPALFPIWDNAIATAHGFAFDPDGYHQHMKMTQGIARRVRGFGRWYTKSALENSLWSTNWHSWRQPLVKIIDEWNWIRITRKTPRRVPEQPRGIRPGKQPIKDALRQLMKDIDAGRVHIRKLNSGATVHVDFVTDNGWKLQVFNDVGDWDYLNSAEDPNGNSLDYEDINSDEKIEGPVKHLLWGLTHYHDFDPEFPDHEPYD